jgi:hypothetical protein
LPSPEPHHPEAGLLHFDPHDGVDAGEAATARAMRDSGDHDIATFWKDTRSTALRRSSAAVADAMQISTSDSAG